eukprot:m.106410 g.106410  ORF g.106410 m.106410 type:complete len:1318 (+) comp37261_c0_seq4:23-3976(+)
MDKTDFTREQKLVFCLAANLHLQKAYLNALKIAQSLAEHEVLAGNDLDEIRALESNTGRNLFLFKSLFASLSSQNIERNKHLSLFLQTVAKTGTNQQFLADFLPVLISTDSDLDRRFRRLRNPFDTNVCTILTRILASCTSAHQRTLSASSLFGAVVGLIDKKETYQVKIKPVSRLLRVSESQLCFKLLRKMIAGFRTNESLMKTVALASCHIQKSTAKLNQAAGNLLPMAMLHRILERCCHAQDKSQAQPLLIKTREFYFPTVKMAGKKAIKTEQNQRKQEQKKRTDLDDDYEFKIYTFAFEEVGPYWKVLGASLKFSKPELDDIERFHLQHRQDSKYMAWEVLTRYWMDKGSRNASIDWLRKLLLSEKRRSGTKVEEENENLGTLPFEKPVLYGRDREMKRIEAFLWGCSKDESVVQPMEVQKLQVLSGVGGVGKSSLMQQFAYLHEKSYSNGIFSFNAESRASLQSSFKTNLFLVTKLGGTNFEYFAGLPSEETRIEFFHYIKKNPRCLILYDSADDLEVLKDCLPKPATACHIIITTRRSQRHLLFKQRNAHVLPLTVLEPDSAISALLSWAGKIPTPTPSIDADEKKFAKMLAIDPPVARLPLAITHAGVFIEQHEYTFQMYWHRLRGEKEKLDAAATDLEKFLRYFHLSHVKERLQTEQHVKLPEDLVKLDISTSGLDLIDQNLLNQAVKAWKERYHVFLTWEMDLDDVMRRCQEGYAILQCCSVMSSKDIPKDVIVNSSFPFSTNAKQEYILAKGWKALNERSLIQRTIRNDKTVYSVHHLIQASMFQRLAANRVALRDTLAAVSRCLIQLLPPLDHIYHRLTSPELQDLVPHIYSVAEKMLEASMIAETFPGLINYACWLAHRYGHLYTAKLLCTLRVKCSEEASLLALSDEGALFKRRLYYGELASACFKLENYAEAVHNIILGIGGRLPRELSSEQIASFLDEFGLLACCYYEQGKLVEAEHLLVQITGSLYSLGMPASYLFETLLRLSYVYWRQERFDCTLEALQNALVLCESGSYDAGIDLALCQERIGSSLHFFGRSLEAIEHYKKACEIYRKYLPDDDERIGRFLIEMSLTLVAVGRNDEGLRNSAEGVSILKVVFPPEHPRIAIGLLWHGRNLQLSKKSEEAMPVLMESLRMLKKCPQQFEILKEVANCLTVIGDVYCQTKRPQEAYSYLKKSVNLNQKLFPSGKVELASSLLKLASVSSSCKRFTEAVSLSKEALLMSKKLPMQNAARISFVLTHVQCLSTIGDFDAAEQAIADATRDCQSLPPDDPALQQLNFAANVLPMMRNLGSAGTQFALGLAQQLF